MKLQVKIQLLKFCSAVINSIFMVLGLSVAGCGVWILFGTENFLTVIDSVELHTVAFGLLVVGAVVVLVSVVGCVGTDREHRFLLLLYLGFLIVLVLGQLFLTLLLLVNRDKVQQTLEDQVDHMIVGYRGNSYEDRLLDNLQRYVKCCGRTEPSDWLGNRYLQTEQLNRSDVLPCSCFSSFPRRSNSSFCSSELEPRPPLAHGNNSYTQGCSEALSVWFQENVLTIVSMDVGLIFIQMFQFGLVFSLYRAVTTKAGLKRSNQLADADHAHLGHAPSDDDELDPGEQNYAYIHPDDPAYYYDTIDAADHHDNQVYLQPAQ